MILSRLIGAKRSASIISHLEAPEILSILEELNSETKEQILKNLSVKLKKELELFLSNRQKLKINA